MAGTRNARSAAARADLVRLGIAPRGLSLQQAAAYVGLCPRAFAREVSCGRFPPPLQLNSKRRIWDRKALDRAFDVPVLDPEDEVMRAIRVAS
jgi:hypothetical protein